MGKVINSLANGTGSLITRALVTAFVAFAVFSGNQISQDIRTKFNELTHDIRELRNDIKCVQINVIGIDRYRQDISELRAAIASNTVQMHKLHTRNNG